MKHEEIHRTSDGVVTMQRVGGWVFATTAGIYVQNDNGNTYRLRARPLPKRHASRRTTGGRLRPLKRAPTLRPGRMG